MAAIMSTGQITLVDLTDERVSSFYLQANQSKIQVYDTNDKSYTPNFEASNLIIEPFLFFGVEDNSTKLNANNLTYTINGAAVGSFTGAVQNGSKLTISQNINTSNSVAPFNQNTLKIVATIKEEGVTDDKTGLPNSSIITADIEFAKVSTGLQGTNGIGVSDVNQLYILTENSTDVPNTPDKGNTGWSENNPTWDGTKVQYLWICTETVYTDGTKAYSAPYTDMNWKTATEAVKDMEQSFGTLRDQVGALQNEVDSAIETWYLEGEPSLVTPPWGEEDNEKHIGDLYYDTKTGYSYRFFKNTQGSYEWTRISDSDVTKALEQVSDLQTVVDGKVTIYYDAEQPVKANIDDLWIKPDGNFRKWNGTSWELVNENIDRIEIQYNKNQSNITPPSENDANWTTSTPEWEEGYYIWQRTVTYYKEATNGEISEPTCISVAGAKGEAGADAIFAIVESTSGKVIFTDADSGDIALKASLYVGGVVQTSNVSYSWTSIPSGVTGSGQTLTVSRDKVPSARSFVCAITYDGKNYTDSIALSDKTDSVYCVIESSKGDKFTNGNVSTTLKCRVFDAYGEVDTAGTKYTYTWEKYNSSGIKDQNWTKTGKTTQISSSDVDAKAVFTCTITL